VVAAADTIWRVPGYLPYLQPPLTDEAIAAAEQEIGFTLSADYLNLLRRQNGGYIRFSLPEMAHDTIAGIVPYFPSLTGFDWDECQAYVSSPLMGLIPFDGDGHWHICLDYHQNAAIPSVSHPDIECDRQSQVASSFADDLSLLRIDVGDEYVLESASDIESIKSQLSSRLTAAFDPPDSWAHGYATYRARLGTQLNPQWLWLSPNNIPRGFVRSDDARYAQLKDLLPGNAPRYPDVPQDSLILSVTSGVRAKVIGACIDSQLRIRPLRECIGGI
jgi:hypothetical protein